MFKSVYKPKFVKYPRNICKKNILNYFGPLKIELWIHPCHHVTPTGRWNSNWRCTEIYPAYLCLVTKQKSHVRYTIKRHTWIGNVGKRLNPTLIFERPNIRIVLSNFFLYWSLLNYDSNVVSVFYTLIILYYKTYN